MITRTICDKYNLTQMECIFNKQIRAELIYKEVETIITQIDSLNFEDKKYDRKYTDLNLRLDAIYDQLEYAEMQLNDSRKRKEAILEEKITSDNIYKILVNFNSLYTVLSDIDKKRLLNELIEEIQIYDEKTEKSTCIKSVVFKLPLIDYDIDFSLDNKDNVESVVLMSLVN